MGNNKSKVSSEMSLAEVGKLSSTNGKASSKAKTSLRNTLRLTKKSPAEEAIARTRAEQRQHTLLMLHHISRDNYQGVNEAINHNAQLEYNKGEALKTALARGQVDIIALLIRRGARTDQLQLDSYPSQIRQIINQNGRASQRPLGSIDGQGYFV